MASMLLLSSTTYAVEMSKSHNPTMQMTTMSKAEAVQMLKDAGVEPSKIKMLENGEMAQIQGKNWFTALISIIAAAVGAFFGSGGSVAPGHTPGGIFGN